MCKDRRIRRFAVSLEVLSDHSRNSHRNPNKAVLVNASPDDIEPRQARTGCSEQTTAASLEPTRRPNPRFRLNATEVILLCMEIRRNIMAQQRKEGGNRKGFVAFGHDLEVYRVPVVPEGQERGHGVDGYHEEDSDDASLS